MKRKRTRQTLAILRVLSSAGTSELYGPEIVERCGIRDQAVYPILKQLDEAGRIKGRWEDRGNPPSFYSRVYASNEEPDDD